MKRTVIFRLVIQGPVCRTRTISPRFPAPAYPAFVLFARLPMPCVFVLWFVMGPIEGHRIGNRPLAPPQA